MNRNFISEITAITPIDGRYRHKTQELSTTLSEFSLIKYRVEVEVKYLIALSVSKIIRKLNTEELNFLEKIYTNFSTKDAVKIKQLEEETRHDIKAIEKFLILSLKKTSLKDLLEYLHFGITSEDINNISYRLMLKTSINNVFLNKLIEIEKSLFKISHKHKKIEIFNYYNQLKKETTILKRAELTGKLNGAIGNYNALYFVYPKIN